MAISVGLGAVAVKNRVDSYPGLGREAVRVVQIVGPEGVVDVLDVQPSMLDATRQRAQRHRLYNVVTSTADASDRFPYPDATFDAAPDERGRGDPRAAADPGRTHRVLKPTGRAGSRRSSCGSRLRLCRAVKHPNREAQGFGSSVSSGRASSTRHASLGRPDSSTPANASGAPGISSHGVGPIFEPTGGSPNAFRCRDVLFVLSQDGMIRSRSGNRRIVHEISAPSRTCELPCKAMLLSDLAWMRYVRLLTRRPLSGR